MRDVTTYRSAEEFLDAFQAVLETRSAENSLLLGVASGLVGSPPPVESFIATVGESDEILAMLVTPPYPLVLGATERPPADAVLPLAAQLHDAGVKLTGVVGPPELAERFASEWTRVSGRPAAGSMRQGIYTLTNVQKPSERIPGHLRRAAEQDLELVTEWIRAFEMEAMGATNPERTLHSAKRRVEEGSLYLWEDGHPKGMAGRARPTRNLVAVNSVYTPPELRGGGIATAAVAELSELLLEEGFAMCVLYTDLSNPTSNSIYSRIGYERVADSVHIRFERGAA